MMTIGIRDEPPRPAAVPPFLLKLCSAVRVMTNNPRARTVDRTMETTRRYEKAGLHCRTNRRQDSSFSPSPSTQPASSSISVCRCHP